jgi:predicted nucleic acid-binding Zn ribbon protein
MVTPRRRKNKNPQPIGKLISQFLKSRGLEKAVREQAVIIEWEKIVGEKIARQAHPVDVKDGVLFLKVTHAVWRNQLFFMKGDIIKTINAYAKRRIVHSIYFSS